MTATLKQNKWLTAGITKFHDSAAVAQAMLPFTPSLAMPRV